MMETGVVGASGAGKWVRRRGCQAPHSNHHRHLHLFVMVTVAFFVIVIAIITIFPVIIVFFVVDKMPAQPSSSYIKKLGSLPQSSQLPLSTIQGCSESINEKKDKCEKENKSTISLNKLCLRHRKKKSEIMLSPLILL